MGDVFQIGCFEKGLSFDGEVVFFVVSGVSDGEGVGALDMSFEVGESFHEGTGYNLGINLWREEIKVECYEQN